MHSFKKGDKVLGPKGCVAIFDEPAAYDTAWFYAGDDHDSLFRWRLVDCQPATDYAPLVEAVKKVVNVWSSSDGYSRFISISGMCELSKALRGLTHAPSVEMTKGRSDDEDHAKKTVDAGLYEAARKVCRTAVPLLGFSEKRVTIETLGNLEKALDNSKPAETFQDFWDRVIDKTDSDVRISNVTMNYMYKHCMYAWDKPKECGEWCEHYVESEDVCLIVGLDEKTSTIRIKNIKSNPNYGMPGCPHVGSDA